MSENNEEIINSAFSFSDVKYLGLEREPDTDGKYIKTWQINKNIIKETEEEEDKTQFEEEETEYEETPTAIQEEYETYGTENKQRLTKRTFYKKPNGSPEVAYLEVFQYKDSDMLTLEESGISKLIDSKGKTIGHRYYRNGINDVLTINNDFVTIVEYLDGQYHPIQGTGEYERDLEIINSIFKEHYKNGIGYEISGNREKTLGISAIAKLANQNIYVFSPGEQLKDNYYLTHKERKRSIIPNSKNIHTPTCFNTGSGYILEGISETEVSKFDLILVNEKILGGNKEITLFPLSFASHATLYLIDNKSNSTTQHLIDFSLGHCEKDENGIAVSVNRDYFGIESNNINLLNKFPMQINGTCSFYADAILSVIANPSNKYDNIENIQQDCGNGIMWLKVMAEMGKIFDINQDYPTVKEFSDEKEVLNDTNKYVIFKINDVSFGISKECYNNKFVDMKVLIDCLQINTVEIKQQLSKQLELQKEIIKAQRIMYLLNKCTKQFNTLDEILDKKIKRGKLSKKEDCPDYNYYSESNLRCKNFKERYEDNLNNFIKHLSSIELKKLKEGTQELLNEVSNIGNIRQIMDDEYYKTFERSTKEFLEKIKFSAVESLSNELLEDPELQNVLEQLETLDESLSLQKIDETSKTKTQPFAKKHSLIKSHSQPNLSFRKRVELEKQKNSAILKI